MKEERAFEYAQTRHGLSLDTEEVGVACSIAGFIKGWEAAANYVPTKPPIEKSYVDIRNIVSARLGVLEEELRSTCRDRDFVEARVVFSMIAKEMIIKASYKKIGDCISRDHSSIAHYLKNLTEYPSIKEKKDLCIEEYYKKHMS